MRRRLFKLLSAVSLLLCVVATSLFVRTALGNPGPVRIARHGEYEVASSGYRLWLLRNGRQVTTSRGPPLLGLAFLFAAPPALALRVFKGDGRPRPRPGFCRACGYDLRATPERCPECGALTKGAA